MAVDTNVCICIGVTAIAVVLLYLALRGKKKELYANIGDLSHIGAVESPAYGGAYEPVSAPEMSAPAEVFAGMVADAEQREAPPSDVGRAVSRMERMQGSDLLPRNSRLVTPYNIDVADPLTHSFSVNAPRVQLKNPRWESSLFMALNGDIPIKYHPNIPLIGKSRYDRDSWMGSGVFSDSFRAMYNRYTGQERLNMPIYVANGETIMS